MESKIKDKVEFYDIALFLLFFITGIIVTTAIFFILGVSISSTNILLPLVLTVFLTYRKQHSVKKTIYIAVISSILVLICILISKEVYDGTYDGACYHKQAVGFLKEGWNPVYQSAPYFNELSHSILYPSANPMQWAECYPKASWYFAAPVYCLTGNIEAGKAYTLIFVIITFGIFYDYLKQKSLKRWQVLCISALAALNPMALAQIQTYYLDGMVSCVLMCLLLLFTAYWDKEYNRKDIYGLVFCLIIIGCNTKFSVALFVGTYCIIFFLYSIWKNRKTMREHVRNFTFFAFSALFSVFIVGFSPFLTNTVRYHNPLQGFSNLVSSDKMADVFGIASMSNAKMFFASLFGKMSHGEYKTLGELLKVPFTFSKEELYYYFIPDTRVGGFGVFFSGILVIALIIMLYTFIKQYRKNNPVTQMMGIFFAVSIVEMMILPATFTARYIGQLYLIPIAALVISFTYWNKSQINSIKILSRALGCILSICMIVNMLPWGYVIIQRINKSIDTTATLNYLSQVPQKNRLDIAFWEYDFTGMHYNLKDFNIKYNFISKEKTDESFKRTYLDWIYYKINE